ncbi:MAG: DEAD/DEAH box helicase [Novosphingobium sp.]|nr:DEAD/DEAH box helicase [Novosphingobium sp.]
MRKETLSGKNVENLLKEYQGKNPYIKELKERINRKGGKLYQNEINYVFYNINKEPILINKIYEISDWLANSFQKEYSLSFQPKKILIGYLLSNLDNSYHCYVKFHKNQERAVCCFIPKKALFGVIDTNSDWNNVDINFNKLNDRLSSFNRTLKPHQEDGIKFLYSKKRAILGDGCGLGKTIMSLSASTILDKKKVLIITPASLKTNWKREIGFFYDDIDSKVNIIESNVWVEPKQFTIINYDILQNFYKLPLVPKMVKERNENGEWVSVPKTKKVKNYKTGVVKEEIQYRKSTQKDFVEQCKKESILLNTKWDLVIIDEIHKLSNNDSTIYQIINDFIKKNNPEHFWGISGTFLTNSPKNLLNIINLLDPLLFSDYQYFMQRYCDAKKMTNKKTGAQFWIEGKECKNLDELSKKIEHIYIRRTIEEQGLLNEYNITELYYGLTGEERTQYDALWEEYKMEKLENDEEVNEEDLEDCKKIIEGGLFRRYLSNLMIKNSINIAEKHIENGEKVLIACCYDNEIKELKKHFGDKAVIYNGKMSSKEKDKSEKEFMNNDNVKVMCCNIIACGVGINLTEGNIVVFNTFSWRDDENIQMIARSHRMGQKKGVMVYFQLFEDTHLTKMWEKVQRKKYIIEKVIKTENEKTSE